ncbi:E3 ubiquitin-protein ligase RNF8 [Ricinus communis]|uniref:Ubiquitin-protein ligase, putative n=1 Tax=Ricinus communis TaxID=3988 RepID=B9SH71_RICCO|nr:E3 ubiquitin-protein ligase RNF8 [Ricinus communis]XP_015578577.1 E3 ubiquitin-protein ligase RNF8 [Ricinus communis]EEF37073.1 ubiquitin-protein ligase, putative [Ricinus communis]|eukprot:XP_002525340.1 E3 ubiquitin-protein ligase RNF8 [Ricinus communis]
MNGPDAITKWKNLKQLLSFKGLGCCGATWTPRTTIRTIIEEESDQEEEPIIIIQQRDQVSSDPTVVMGSGMNLAMALAEERNLRRSSVGPAVKSAGPPMKTLMRLIEETEGVDLMRKNKRRGSDEERIINNIIKKEKEGENDWVCCVCMERNKGAAFIPCGHTFCRICCREMWVNRGTCPICNRPIVEILDLF